MIQAFENFRTNTVIAKVCEFQRSFWYVLCLALVALISHLAGIELVAIWLIVLATVFSLVMQEDALPLVPTVLLGYFLVSCGHGAISWSDVGVWQTKPYIVNLAIVGVLFAVAFIFHLVYYKQYKNFARRTYLTLGLAAFAVAYLINGIFSKGYTFKNMAYGFSFAALFYLFYLIIFHMVKWKDGESMRYLARCMFVMGLLISIELACLYIRNPELHGVLSNKNDILLGWGNSNSIAFTTLLALPFAFWLAYKEKYGFVYYLGASVMVLAIFFTYARGSLVVAIPMYAVGSIFLCIKARKKLGIWICVGVIVITLTILAIWFKDWLHEKFNIYIINGTSDRGRFRLWEIAWEGFKQSPVFGSGLYFKFGEEPSNYFWAHNTILQLLATCGIVGLLTYLLHRVQTIIMFFKKPTMARLFIGIAILGILAAGMVDVVMICQNVILYYGILLAFAEKDYLYRVGKIDEEGKPIEESKK